MMVKVEDIQQYGKEHLETVVASATSLQNGFQAIAIAYGDYTKKSFEDTKSFVEKLSGVKSLDKAMEVQTEYAKSAYETFVAESQKIAGLYTDLAKQPTKQTLFSKSKSPAVWPGFFLVRICRDYFATRNFDSDVPIELKAEIIWVADVSM